MASNLRLQLVTEGVNIQYRTWNAQGRRGMPPIDSNRLLLPTVQAVRINPISDRLGIRLLEVTRASANNFGPGVLVRIRIVVRGVVLLVANRPRRCEDWAWRVATEHCSNETTGNQ